MTNMSLLNWIINWTKPRSTERYTAFRERIVRQLVLVLMGLLAVTLLLFPSRIATANDINLIWNRLNQVLFAIGLLVAVGWFISHGHITLAVVFFVSLPALATMLSFAKLGYWSASAALELFVTLVLGGMLLPRRIFVPFMENSVIIVPCIVIGNATRN